MILDQIFLAFWAAVVGPLQVLAILVGADIVLGIVRAFASGTFELERVADFFVSDGVPIIGWLVGALIFTIPSHYFPDAGFEAFASIGEKTLYAAVFLKIFASVMGHLASFGLLQNQLKVIGVKGSAVGQGDPPVRGEG